ncbi:hypothetical protein AVEN_18260-1 [Araneus ventricosus]|uniref:Uncharacterized protein n=1 Tax=Araneus ventricosus TaxID=182803 RepID=A0A4Y2AKH6_ARAVE|nr:hypothetical protein AVEN_18260-1 [Araneus ventricosus]
MFIRHIYRAPTKVSYHSFNYGIAGAIFIRVVSKYGKVTMRYWMKPLTAPPGGNGELALLSLKRENIDSGDFPTLIESSEPGTSKSEMRKYFITPKLVAALDRCQLSMGDSVIVLEATIDALGCNIDEFPISKFSIQRIRTEKRKESVENIKIDFQNEVPDVVTLHWDGKLLPAFSARKAKEERLPIVISYGLKKTHCFAETG